MNKHKTLAILFRISYVYKEKTYALFYANWNLENTLDALIYENLYRYDGIVNHSQTFNFTNLVKKKKVRQGSAVLSETK